MCKQRQKERLIDFPTAVLVGVSQSGMAWGLCHAKMDQFTLTSLQSFLDLAQAVCMAKLAKQHRDELIPAGKTARLAHPLVLANSLVEQRPGNWLENLTENSGYLCHGWFPFG